MFLTATLIALLTVPTLPISIYSTSFQTHAKLKFPFDLTSCSKFGDERHRSLRVRFYPLYNCMQTRLLCRQTEQGVLILFQICFRKVFDNGTKQLAYGAGVTAGRGGYPSALSHHPTCTAEPNSQPTHYGFNYPILKLSCLPSS